LTESAFKGKKRRPKSAEPDPPPVKSITKNDEPLPRLVFYFASKNRRPVQPAVSPFSLFRM
jgi:hypothetical protein